MQLTNLGINQQFVTFTHVTMESEKLICVRETAPSNSVVIVDMAMPMQPLRRPITADSALMHPDQKILALKGMYSLPLCTFGARGESEVFFSLHVPACFSTLLWPPGSPLLHVDCCFIWLHAFFAHASLQSHLPPVCFDANRAAMIQGTTQDHLQIFNIEAKAKLKSYQMPEQVLFTSEQNLALHCVALLHTECNVPGQVLCPAKKAQQGVWSSY